MEERLSVEDFIIIGLMGTSVTHEHYEPIQTIFQHVIRRTPTPHNPKDFRFNIELAIKVFYDIKDTPDFENLPNEWLIPIAIGLIKKYS